MRRTLANLAFGLTLLMLVVSLADCSNRSRTYSIPQHIEFDTASGVWTVKTAGTGSAEELPEWIGVVTIWGEQSQEGVWLVPDTAGAAALLVATKRGYTTDSGSSTSLIEVPSFVESSAGGWRIRFTDKRVYLSDSDTKQLKQPPKMQVPIRQSSGGRRLDSSIEREAMPR